MLRDPKAAQMLRSLDFDKVRYTRGAGGGIVALRTAIFDYWARGFLAKHPAGSVAELGTGLNTRFERVDNGHVGAGGHRTALPARYRYLLPLANPVIGNVLSLTLFRAEPVTAG